LFHTKVIVKIAKKQLFKGGLTAKLLTLKEYKSSEANLFP